MKSKNVNKALLIFVLRCLVTFCAVFFFSALCWVGAECIFEGAPHTSAVDFVVNILLAGYLTGGVVNIQNKLLRLKKIEGAGGKYET